MKRELGQHFLDLIKDITNNLRKNRGLHDILQFLCSELSESLISPIVGIGLKEKDGTVHFVARAGDAAMYLDTMAIRWDESEYGNGTVGRAIKTGKPQLYDIRGQEVLFLPWLKILKELKINTALALPIFDSCHEVIGTLVVYSMDIDAYSQDQIDILEIYCTQISLVIELEKAKESLKNYELLSEYSRDIILFIKPNGSIIEANRAAETAYLYTKKELKKLRIYDLRLEDQQLVHAQMETAQGRGILFETYHKRKDGSIFPVEVSSIGYQLGEEPVLLSIIRDITERKEQRII